MIFDKSGNLYGTTQGCLENYGTVFEWMPSASSWNYSTIFDFGYSAGNCPVAGLIFDRSGNLYGATVLGAGVAVELSLSGSTWTLNRYYDFTGNNGSTCGPLESLIIDKAGNLYGTTYCDGANGLGSVFKLTPSSGGWTYTDLHDFSGSDGANPIGGLVIDRSGKLYGTASKGGSGTACTGGCGVVFEITP